MPRRGGASSQLAAVDGRAADDEAEAGVCVSTNFTAAAATTRCATARSNHKPAARAMGLVKNEDSRGASQRGRALRRDAATATATPKMAVPAAAAMTSLGTCFLASRAARLPVSLAPRRLSGNRCLFLFTSRLPF